MEAMAPKAPKRVRLMSQAGRFYYEGNTRIAKPGECCTDLYRLGAF